MIAREILFRGQTRRKGQKVWMDGTPVESNWVYGGVCHGTGDFSIIYGNLDEERERPTEKWVVYTDTVGQYTGLTDKNGKKIFEGDIVEGADFNCEDGYGEIEWDECGARFVIIGHEPNNLLADFDNYYGHEVEVIGNIYDNPELLGGESE